MNSLKKKGKRSFNIVLLFIYIYNIAFAFLPLLFRTRIILGLYGITKELSFKKKIDQIVINIVGLNLLFVISNVMSSLASGYFDFWFSQHAILNILYLFGGIYIAKRFSSIGSIESFFGIIVWVITLHNILALIAFLYPPLGDLFINIQKMGSEDSGGYMSTIVFRSRFLGLGIGSFFTGGIISGLGVILTFYLIKVRYFKALKGTLIILILLGTGLFIARTSIIGLIGLFLLMNRNNYKLALNIIIKTIILGGIIGGIIYAYLPEDLPIEWAFEVFINIFSSDKIETSSTNELIKMWVLPTDISTWLLGDGLFSNPDGTYYMHTDVGYLRIIYCLGLVGLLVFAINQAYLMVIVPKLCKALNNLVFVLAVYIIILNIKGFAEINFLFYLIIGYLINHRTRIPLNESSYKCNITSLQRGNYYCRNNK